MHSTLPGGRVQQTGRFNAAPDTVLTGTPNPLAIIRPCHRVIGSDGTMRGYAGGVERKQQLLAHEGALLPI